MAQTLYKRLYFALVGTDNAAPVLVVRDGEGRLANTAAKALLGIPVASGTAVLIAGTKVVTDAKITANSIIRLTNKTLGGTAGAVYVSAKTASTSFAITSTSNTDTSTVFYEVISY